MTAANFSDPGGCDDFGDLPLLMRLDPVLVADTVVRFVDVPVEHKQWRIELQTFLGKEAEDGDDLVALVALAESELVFGNWEVVKVA